MRFLPFSLHAGLQWEMCMLREECRLFQARLHPSPTAASPADEGILALLLSTVAAGWNTVEREGISISHP